MRTRFPVLLALAALAAASPALAEAPASGTGPLVALRAGVGFPRGEIDRDGPEVADLVSRRIPIGLELGYRFGDRIWGELFFELSPASAASSLCSGGADCFASDARLGVGVVLRIAPRSVVDPWIGVGIGVEVMNAKGAMGVSPSETESSWAGYELPYVEAGFDVAVSRRLGLGPWASLTVSRFTSESTEVEGSGTVSRKIQDRSSHGWVSGGLKATLKL